ncbi:hypothetical protein [Epilithonimonas sp.]|nr:hypothetical protein [Epilithonimonas sp.]
MYEIPAIAPSITAPFNKPSKKFCPFMIEVIAPLPAPANAPLPTLAQKLI